MEDGAELSEGGRPRERSMHASLDQAKYFLSRVEPWVGVKDIQLLVSNSQTQVYQTLLMWPRPGTVIFQRSPRVQDAI